MSSKPCRFGAKCRFGAECRFAHPNTASASASASASNKHKHNNKENKNNHKRKPNRNKAASSREAAVTAKSQPIDLTIMIDRSYSMSGTRLAECQKAVKSIAKALRPDDYLSVSTFTHEAPQVCVRGKVKKIRSSASAAINALEADGGTALWDAIGATMEATRARKVHYNHTQAQKQGKQSRRCKVIVLTDGEDQHSKSWTLSKVRAAVARPGFPMQFILVGVGISGSTARDLESICEPVTATYKHIVDARGIAKVFHWVQETVLMEKRVTKMVKQQHTVLVKKTGAKQYGR